MPLYKDKDGVLSQFRGLNVGRELEEPKSASGFVDKIFLDCKIGKVSPLREVMDNWNSIIEPQFHSLCEPCDIGATVLYVRTYNSTAKQELMFLEKKILKKVNTLGGCSKIRKIKFL